MHSIYPLHVERSMHVSQEVRVYMHGYNSGFGAPLETVKTDSVCL